MPKSRTNCSWSILVFAFFIFSSSCRSISLPSSNEYRGTIYYVDHKGVWKEKLPNPEVMLSDRGVLFPNNLTVSLDQQWLAYTESEITNSETELISLWVISTQGGNLFEVSHDLSSSHMYWLPNNQLLYQENQRPWTFDPRTQAKQIAQGWVFQSDCFVSVNPTGENDILESCRPTENSRGYLRIMDLGVVQK